MQPLSHFPLNPAYGAGTYRRRIRLTRQGNRVTAQLDDNNHALWARLHHDGAVVTRTEGGFYRWPTTGCVSAAEGLGVLEGMALDAPLSAIYGGGRPLGACTHMFDIAALAMAHAGRAEARRQWDVVIPDEQEGILTVSVLLDDRLIHAWRLDDLHIVAPAPLAGQSMLKGFTPWAMARFEGDALEAARVLRMGVFVARARLHITDEVIRPLALFPERHGVCYAYSSPRVETAENRRGTVVDMSDGVIEAPDPPPLID